MAKIDRLGRGPGATISGSISPSSAAAPNMAAAEVENQINTISQQYFDEARQATQNAQYTSAIADATERLNQRAMERMQQRTDEEGNPTFERLPNDIKKISKEIENEVAGKLFDPAVKRKFQEQFTRHSLNQRVLALKTARQQQVDFSRESVSNGLRSLEVQAAQGDPSSIDGYMGMAQDILNEALESGAITAQERGTRLAQFKETVLMEQVRTQMQSDPNAALELLSEDSDIGLSSQGKRRLRREAEAAVADRQREERRKQREQEIQVKTQQSLAKEKLETGILAGTVGESEILAAEHSEQITPIQAENLKQSLLRRAKTEDTQQVLFRQLDKDIKAGSDLSQYTSKQINSYYEEAIKVAEENKQEPLSLIEKSVIAADLKRDVSSLTNTLEITIRSGQNGEEAIQAIEYLQKQSPKVLAKMDEKSLLIASIASLHAGTRGDTQQALALARASVLDIDPAVLEERQGTLRDYLKKENTSAEDLVITALQDEDILDTDFFTADDTIQPGHLDRITKKFKDAYLAGGSIEGAQKLVSNFVRRSYSTSVFNGGTELMFIPPESVFKAAPGVLKEDLDSSAKSLGLDPSETFISFDRFDRNGKPLYFVTTQDEFGNEIPALDEDGDVVRWTFDEKAAIERAAQRAQDIETSAEETAKSLDREDFLRGAP